MASNLPSLLGTSAAVRGGRRRDVVQVERQVSREVVETQGRARVAAERGRSNALAIENVAIDVLQAGTQVMRHAVALADSCPMAEPMLRSVAHQAGIALGQVVTDTARELRS